MCPHHPVLASVITPPPRYVHDLQLHPLLWIKESYLLPRSSPVTLPSSERMYSCSLKMTLSDL